ncbi:sucrose-6-phosphate hydrolase [Bordetella avium]|uniref:glycoside hydrolase family 32 protein n=1 Tax=Bordetella avium TaxID=521 RepID=UPI000FDA7591|nr:glycoside hydrolase family 32 protein [Bordetella avium]AZY48116.1 sucrose-6-phosphate hydrolase [Bordetella avium]
MTQPTCRSAQQAGLPRADYRPVAHYSPPQGFMNDPNGLIYLDGLYHLYYQYNPLEPLPGNLHWGHATSPDLLTWQTHEPALKPNARGLVFSGSMVWDRANTSGLFDAAPGGKVALFTRAAPNHQSQDLAYGPIHNGALTLYQNNPVLDIGSTSFRDPRVFWHEASKRWVMILARSREHQLCLYTSSNLREWRLSSTFGPAGLLGLDYECPDLVELPIEGGGSRWVLFLSINPGAPTGGSGIQYFVGHFDGTRFEADSLATQWLDSGQDFYALQTYSNTPGRTLGIAWMNNWLYASAIPAHPARGTLTLPREFRLRRQNGHWQVLQRFVNLGPLRRTGEQTQTWHQASGKLHQFPWPQGQALDIALEGELTPGATFTLRLSNDADEQLDVGFHRGPLPGFFIDRSRLRGFAHPFWTHKAIQSVLHDFQRFDCHLIIDQSSVEFLGMDGSLAMTLLHFFKHPPQYVQCLVENGVMKQGKMIVWPIGGPRPHAA